MDQNTFEIKSLWERSFKEPIYCVAIGNLIGDNSPEIMAASFDKSMKVYDLKGNPMLETEFPSEITQFMCAPITNAKNIEIISGDINGNVRLMTKKGKFIWSISVGSAITSMDLGDVTEEDRYLEVIVGLQNQKIVLLNYRGEILFSEKAPEPIIDVTLGALNSNEKETMMALTKTGVIYSVSLRNEWEKITQITGNPTCFTFFYAFDLKGFLIGFQNGEIRIIDTKGNLLAEYLGTIQIQDIDKQFITSTEGSQFLMIIGAGTELQVFYLIKNEKINLGNTDQTQIKSSEVGSLNKKTELPTFQLNSFPVQNKSLSSKEIENETKKELQNKQKPKLPQTIPESSQEKQLKCPECGDYLPQDFEARLLRQLDVFCETCGRRLRIEDLSLMR